MLKIGLIGAGRWGKIYLKTIEKNTRCRINALLSKNSEVNNLISKSCEIYSSSEDFFRKEMQAVIIATPPKTHLEFVTMAVEKKIPVLVEKPLTTSVEESINAREIAKRNSCLVVVDHIHVFSNAFQALKANILKLGKIYEIESFAGNFGPYRNDVSVLWDWAPHDISMILDLLNATASDANILSYDNKKKFDKIISETLYIKLNIKNILINISISNNIQKTRIFRVYCERGVIEYDDIKYAKVKIYPSQSKKILLDGEYQTCKFISAPPLDMVINCFIDLVIKKSNFHNSLDMGVEVVQIISKIEKLETC